MPLVVSVGYVPASMFSSLGICGYTTSLLMVPTFMPDGMYAPTVAISGFVPHNSYGNT